MSNLTQKQESRLKLQRFSAAKDYIRAIDHELRLDILDFLHQNPNSYVKTIYKTMDIEQSIVSQQLRILKSADLVYDERDGKNVIYSINYDRLKQLSDSIHNFIEPK